MSGESERTNLRAILEAGVGGCLLGHVLGLLWFPMGPLMWGLLQPPVGFLLADVGTGLVVLRSESALLLTKKNRCIPGPIE